MVMVVLEEEEEELIHNTRHSITPREPTITRKRKDIVELFAEIGPMVFRRMYRMHEPSFWTLLELILPSLPSSERKRGATPNGPITPAARLSMALRYFSGGDPLDIGPLHGVEPGQVLMSVWMVVDAINYSSSFCELQYPSCQRQQAEIAAEFQIKSKIGLANCAGAIDGILIWIHKPMKRDIDDIGFGESKFFCGRKKKFGLNMQAVCDAHGRFLDVEIRMPGSSSDFYAILQSDLRKRLELDILMSPGLTIYGDNAYVNTLYMVVPFKGVQDGAKDAFNFFHSSLRINIECAFGMLVHRFGILQKPMPVNIKVKQVTSLVACLCWLHNFCIDQREINLSEPSPKDIAFNRREGGFGVRIDTIDAAGNWGFDETLDRVHPLLDGGNHLEDTNRSDRRRYHSQSQLPVNAMLKYIYKPNY